MICSYFQFVTVITLIMMIPIIEMADIIYVIKIVTIVLFCFFIISRFSITKTSKFVSINDEKPKQEKITKYILTTDDEILKQFL